LGFENTIPNISSGKMYESPIFSSSKVTDFSYNSANRYPAFGSKDVLLSD